MKLNISITIHLLKICSYIQESRYTIRTYVIINNKIISCSWIFSYHH